MLIEDEHPGYITFEQYERNQRTLLANAAAHSETERSAGPAREGPALLQGLVVCGKCGKRMTVSCHARCNGERLPDYDCSREGIATGTPPCQTICGAGVDQAVANLVSSSSPRWRSRPRWPSRPSSRSAPRTPTGSAR